MELPKDWVLWHVLHVVYIYFFIYLMKKSGDNLRPKSMVSWDTMLEIEKSNSKKLKSLLRNNEKVFIRILKIIYTLDYVKRISGLKKIKINVKTIGEYYKRCYGGGHKDISALIRPYLRGDRVPQELVRIFNFSYKKKSDLVSYFIRTVRESKRKYFHPRKLVVRVRGENKSINVERYLIDKRLIKCIFSAMPTSMLFEAICIDVICLIERNRQVVKHLARYSYWDVVEGKIGFEPFMDSLIEGMENIREKKREIIRSLENFEKILRDFKKIIRRLKRGVRARVIDFNLYSLEKILEGIMRDDSENLEIFTKRFGTEYPPFTTIAMCIPVFVGRGLEDKIDKIQGVVDNISSALKFRRAKYFAMRIKNMLEMLKEMQEPKAEALHKLLLTYGGDPLLRNKVRRDDDPGLILWTLALIGKYIREHKDNVLPNVLVNYMDEKSVEKLLKKYVELYKFLKKLKESYDKLFVEEGTKKTVEKCIEKSKILICERIITVLLHAFANNINMKQKTILKNTVIDELCKKMLDRKKLLFQILLSIRSAPNNESLSTQLANMLSISNHKRIIKEIREMSEEEKKTLEEVMKIAYSKIIKTLS